MDRYFYAVEGNGAEKEIHLSGNVYFNDADESDTCYRIAEWTGFCLPLEQVKKLLTEDAFFDYINEKVNYLCDVTKDDAVMSCSTYWDGKAGEKLDIKAVDENTPCGYYWFEV